MAGKPDRKPPPALKGAARARWVTVIKAAVRHPAFDRETLAQYCQIWARWKEAEDGIARSGQLVKTTAGRVVASPLVAIANQSAAQVKDLEERLGLGQLQEATASPIAEKAGPLLTRRDIAAKLSVHMQTVCKWEQDGMPIALVGRKGKPSLYRELDVRAWLAAREEAAKHSGTVDVARERSRKERAQAILAEQAFLMRSRDLLPKAEVDRIWSAEVAAVRTKLLAVPAAYADQIHRAATLEGVTGVEDALKEAVADALRELSDPARAPQPPKLDPGKRAKAAA